MVNYTPRYVLVQNYINDKIHAGVLNPGDRIPSENELAKIYQLNLSDDKELEEVRDIFIVGCYTGLRYSDLSTLNNEHIDLVKSIR